MGMWVTFMTLIQLDLFINILIARVLSILDVEILCLGKYMQSLLHDILS